MNKHFSFIYNSFRMQWREARPTSNLTTTSELQIFFLHAWTIFMCKYAGDYIWCLLIIMAAARWELLIKYNISFYFVLPLSLSAENFQDILKIELSECVKSKQLRYVVVCITRWLGASFLSKNVGAQYATCPGGWTAGPVNRKYWVQ